MSAIGREKTFSKMRRKRQLFPGADGERDVSAETRSVVRNGQVSRRSPELR
jgi:hypothetical protein